MNGWKGEISAASLDGRKFIRINDNLRANNEHFQKLALAEANENVPKFTRAYLESLGFKFDSLWPAIDLIHLAATGQTGFIF